MVSGELIVAMDTLDRLQIDNNIDKTIKIEIDLYLIFFNLNIEIFI